MTGYLGDLCALIIYMVLTYCTEFVALISASQLLIVNAERLASALISNVSDVRGKYSSR